MAQITQKEQRSETVLTSSLTLGATTAVSFDITNIQAQSLVIYAIIRTGLPPGSGSTGYTISLSSIPPVGSADDPANVLITSVNRSTTGMTILKVGAGLPGTASVTVSTANSFVPPNVRVTVNWSSAAASRSCTMAIGASFINP